MAYRTGKIITGLFTILITVLTLIIFISPVSGENENGFEYVYAAKGAEIISWTGNDNNVSIPVYLGGVPVSGIRAHAFEGRTRLTTIAIPSTVEFIGDFAFANCTNLQMVMPSSGLKEIGESAFSGCTQLTSFTLPASLETIKKNAFAGCKNLVYFLDLTGTSLSEVGRDAFDDTAWFNTITDDLVTICSGHMLLKYRGNEERLTLPWNVMGIAEDAFEGNTNLKSIAISNYMTRLNHGAISGIENLESVTGGDSLEFVAKEAFHNLPNLSQIEFSSVKLNSSNFLNCPLSPFGTETFLVYDTSVPDPSDLYFETAYEEKLDGVVILHCRSDIEFPDGILEFPSTIRGLPVLAIGAGACQNRTDIIQVILPNELEEIRSWAFAYDTLLDEVAFPDSLKTIEGDAFNNCSISSHAPILEGVSVDERAFYISNN